MKTSMKTIQIKGVSNDALIKAGAAKIVGRINDVGAPVQDQKGDGSYNGPVQQSANTVTSSDEIRAVAEVATGRKGLSLEQARDAFQRGSGLRMLDDGEVKGAALIASMVGDLNLVTPNLPELSVKLELPLPERKTSYTLAEAKQLLAEKFPSGEVVGSALPSVAKFTLKTLEDRVLSPVKISSLLARLFKSDDAKITPDSLRFLPLKGDPYSRPDDRLAPGGELLTRHEKAALQLFYAKLFVPERSVELPAPECVSRPIATFEKGRVSLESETTYRLSEKGDFVDVERHHSLVVEAAPGTTVLLGTGDAPTLDTSYVIPASGRLQLRNLEARPVAARVLANEDPSGVISPKLLGSFAVQMPAPDRKHL